MRDPRRTVSQQVVSKYSFLPVSLKPSLQLFFFFFLFLATLRGKLTRDPPCAPGLEVQSLNHRTTREVSKPFLFVFLIVSSSFTFKV